MNVRREENTDEERATAKRLAEALCKIAGGMVVGLKLRGTSEQTAHALVVSAASTVLGAIMRSQAQAVQIPHTDADTERLMGKIHAILVEEDERQYRLFAAKDN